MITCQSIKQAARADWKRDTRTVLKASVLLFVITLILSLLITYISGYNKYTVNMLNIAEELADTPELLINPTEEFLEEYYAEMNAAMPKITPTAAVLVVVILVMTAMINAGFEGYCLKISRREEAKALDIMRSFEHFGKALCLIIIRTLAVAVGSIFFVAPGIIAYYAFSQCFMVMYDHPEYSVFKCLGESAKLMRGYKAMFFVLHFSFILWHFVSNLSAVTLLLRIYSVPYIGISQAHFYNLLARPEIYSETRSTGNEQ